MIMEFYEIFLEFEENTIYKASEITNKLTTKYPELGNEIILPINIQDDNRNIPIFIFSQNENFQIHGNCYNLVMHFNGKTHDEIIEIISSIYEIFDNNKNNFIGIACTYQELNNPIKIDEFKKRYFTNLNSIKEDEIHLSLIREIEINDKKTRCLEGYSTLNNEFISHFEFNMKESNFQILGLDYIISFFKQTTKYKEDKKKCL